MWEDMSFFQSSNARNIISSVFSKYIEDPAALWIFASFLVLGCAIIYPLDKMTAPQETDQDYVTYPAEWSEEVVEHTDDSYPANAQTMIKEPDTLHAKYALLMDADDRRVLFQKDGYTKVPMASTTKIMTLLVALEQGNPDSVVTVSEYAASMPKVKLGMKTGEQYRLGDLLYSLMLESHNDSAVAIAEHIGGSVEGFSQLMNEKAKTLGADNTHFVTPNGLDDKDHYTTAYDLALIASSAIENEEFCRIIQTPTYSFHEQATGRNFTLNNKDRFLTSYEGAIGIKTGFTGNAGYCFVGAVQKADRRLVSVVLASGWPPNKTFKWKDTICLMDYGSKAYQRKKVVRKGTEFGAIQVFDSIEGGTITPYVAESVSLLLKQGENVSFQVKVPGSIKAPVTKGETVGKIIVEIDKQPYKMLPLYAKENKTLLTYSYILKNILFRYFMYQTVDF